MNEAEIFATLPDYEAIVKAINLRRGQMNVSVKTLALAASLQPGFVGSALGPSRTRRLGYLSLPLLLAPLGLQLGLIEAPELGARYAGEMEKADSNQARSNNYASPVSMRVIERIAVMSWPAILVAIGAAKRAAAAEREAQAVRKGAKTNGHAPA